MIQDILKGIRILDFTWVLAGPYATRMMADFGAEVIKIQSKKTSKGVESYLTPYFAAWNRNKRSITLDMSFPEAKEIFLSLCGISDVVIDNFAPRVMANWGLTYDVLKEANPRLVVADISAMGQSGPWRDFVAFGPTLHALAGLSYLTSYNEDEPIGPGYAYGDHIIGLYTALVLLAAIEDRERTGHGSYIDISGYEALCTTLGPALAGTSSGDDLRPGGGCPESADMAPYGCYRCLGEDRWCVIAVGSETEWKALCTVSDNPGWFVDERFSTMAKRKENGRDLDELLTRWTVTRTAEEIVGVLQGTGVASGVVRDARDLAQDPHLISRGFFTETVHPLLGPTVTDRGAIRFVDDEKAVDWKAAPLLGADNDYVFRELLKLTAQDMDRFIKMGVIG